MSAAIQGFHKIFEEKKGKAGSVRASYVKGVQLRERK